MDNFVPGLREAVLDVAESLRAVVYFVCVVGLMMQVRRTRGDVESLVGPIFRGAVVVGLVATLPHWFGFTERVFLGVADTVQDGYTQHPMRTAAKLRETVSSTSEFSLRRVGESVYRAFLDAAMKLVVMVASFLQVPFLILQHVLKLLCYLFLPVALALHMVPALASVGTRYVQQTVAVLAWPVGFAVTELVAYHLLTAYSGNLATAYGLAPGEIDPASFGSLLGGLVAALWIVVGTLGTPVVIQALICSGSPMSGGGQPALQQIYMAQQVAWMIKSVKTGGAALVARPFAGTGGTGGGGGMPPMPPPPAPAPLPPPSAPPSADPSGDRAAAAAMAMTRLPAPQTSI